MSYALVIFENSTAFSKRLFRNQIDEKQDCLLRDMVDGMQHYYLSLILPSL